MTLLVCLLPLLAALTAADPAAAATSWELLPAPWHHAALADVAIAADGATALSASHDGTWKVWDAATGALRCTGALPRDGVTERLPDVSVALSPDGKRAAIRVRGGPVRLADTRTCALGLRIEGVCADSVALVFAPDGDRLAVPCRSGTVEVWRTAGGGKRLHRLAPHPAVYAVAWSSDGSRLLVGGGDDEFGAFSLWDAASGKKVRDLVLDTPEAKADPSMYAGTPSSVRLSPNGTLAVATAWDRVWVWDTATGKRLSWFETGHSMEGADVQLLALSLDAKGRLWLQAWEKLLRYDLSGVRDAAWREGETRAPEATAPVAGPVSFAYGSGADAAGTRAVLGDLEGGVHVMDLARGEPARTLGTLEGEPEATAFLDDGHALVGYEDGRYEVRALPDLRVARSGRFLAAGALSALAVDPTGKRLAVASGDPRGDRGGERGPGVVRVWPLPALDAPTPLTERAGDLPTRLAWSPDGAALVVGWAKGDVEWWDLATGKGRVLGSHGMWVTAVAVAPDGARVASTGEDATARVWTVERGGAALRFVPEPLAPPQSVAWSPDGRLVAAGLAFMARPPGVIVWDAATGKEVRRLEAAGDVVELRYLAPDRLLATTLAPAHAALVWDVTADRVVDAFPSVDGYGDRVALSPDGRHLALVTTGQERTFRVWRRR